MLLRTLFIVVLFLGWMVPAFSSLPATTAAAAEQAAVEPPPSKTEEPNAEKADEPAEGDQAKKDENGGQGAGVESKEEDAEKSKEDEDEVKLTGRFVPLEAVQIVKRPREWKEMEVVKAVEHGTRVKKGDMLVELETEKLDLAIEELQYDVKLGQLGLEEAEESLDLLRKSNALAMESARRAERRAAENLKRFLTLDQEASKEAIEFSLKSSKNWLAYQEEELKQLEQMYKEDDLTEESEEIILKRTKDSVDSARFALRRAEQAHDKGLDVDLPRQHEELESAVQEAAVSLEKAKDTLPSKELQEGLKLKKLQLAQEKLKAKLQRLEEDRETMRITAPVSGIVYYGEDTDGKWPAADSLQAILRTGGILKPNQTIMTIVAARPLQVVASISEKELRHAREGAEVEVEPIAYPETEFDGTIGEISEIPVADGKFRVVVNVKVPDDGPMIMPGMECTVEWDLPGADDDDDAEEADDAASNDGGEKSK